MGANHFVDTYREVQAWHKPNLRSRMRHAALSGLSAKDKLTGAGRELLKKPRIQFLYLHHMFKDEVGQFEQLLQLLKKDHEFLSHTDAVNKILSGTIDRPYVSFSMDDGMKSNLLAADILDKYDAKGCFYVNPGIVGETNYAVIKKHCVEALDFPVVEFMNWDDIQGLQARGHEIGGHTMYHMNMAKASKQELYDDLGKTMDIIKSKCGIVPHFAFPYGTFAHFSRQALQAIFDTGYLSCTTAERGCNINPTGSITVQDLCIRRDQIISHWPMSHQMYFITNSARNASEANNHYPDSWQ